MQAAKIAKPIWVTVVWFVRVKPTVVFKSDVIWERGIAIGNGLGDYDFQAILDADGQKLTPYQYKVHAEEGAFYAAS